FKVLQQENVVFKETASGSYIDLNQASPECLEKIRVILDSPSVPVVVNRTSKWNDTKSAGPVHAYAYKDRNIYRPRGHDDSDIRKPKMALDPIQLKLRKRMKDLQ